MRYTETDKLSGEQFKRLTGVRRETFAAMVEVLTEAQQEKKRRGGRPNKISTPDMLLLTLEYLREYRTYFHIGGSFGVSESYAYKIVIWVENTLIRSGKFSLPGKKALYGDEVEIETILIDATETPIERPQKNRGTGIPERRKDTR